MADPNFTIHQTSDVIQMSKDSPACKKSGGLISFAEMKDFYKCYYCGYEVLKAICPSCHRCAIVVKEKDAMDLPLTATCKSCHWEGPVPKKG